MFLELVQLNNQGFITWATAFLTLASDLDLDITDIDNKFANYCKKAIRNRSISSWFTNLYNIQSNPIVRTYMRFKSDFVIEPYLYPVKKLQYREAISKFRYSSHHYTDVIMITMASQITSLTIVYSTVYSGADQSKHQNSASLAFVWGIHRGPVNSPHKWPVTRKMFSFDDVIMIPWRLKVVDTPTPEHRLPIENALYAMSLKINCTFCWTVK